MSLFLHQGKPGDPLRGVRVEMSFGMYSIRGTRVMSLSNENWEQHKDPVAERIAVCVGPLVGFHIEGREQDVGLRDHNAG